MSLTDQTQNTHWHADPTLKHAPDEPCRGGRYIWGYYALMLTSGGPFKPGDNVPTLIDPDTGEVSLKAFKKITTNHKGEREEILAPDVFTSNTDFTLKLVNEMLHQRFSHDEIVAALSDPNNIGGEYYRWQGINNDDPETYLHRIYERGQWRRFGEGHMTKLMPRDLGAPETLELWEPMVSSLSDPKAKELRSITQSAYATVGALSTDPLDLPTLSLLRMEEGSILKRDKALEGIQIIPKAVPVHAPDCTCMDCSKLRRTDMDGRYVYHYRVSEMIVSALNSPAGEATAHGKVWNLCKDKWGDKWTTRKPTLDRYLAWLVSVGLLSVVMVPTGGRHSKRYRVAVDVHKRWPLFFTESSAMLHYTLRPDYVEPEPERVPVNDEPELTTDEALTLIQESFLSRHTVMNLWKESCLNTL